MPPKISETKGKLKDQPWADRAAQIVIDTTDTLREKGVSPIYRLVRWAIYGTLALLLLGVVSVLTMIATVRLLTVYLFFDQVWITYAILGFIFVILGFLLWAKRKVNSQEK